jgi:DNA repair exonuclease SbcCD ATPase subunit
MSYGSQGSSRRSTGRGRGEVHHEKGKRKGQKHRHGGKYLLEESEVPTFEEVLEKTLGRLSSLGGQTFAFSPFSPYYDDWLLSLKSVLSEFESNPAVNVDETFVKERSQVIADVELKFAERREEEAVLEKATQRLAEQNNLLVQTDTEYAYAVQRLSSERKSEIKSLTRRVRDFEEELEEASQVKASVFSPFARREKSQKTAELTRKLDAAKSELDSAVKAFEVEQDKLRDEYEEKKQAVIEQVRGLEKKAGALETDGSVEDRRFACEELVNSVKVFLQRMTSPQ